MPVPVRRAAAAAPVENRVSFGNLSMYVAGGGLPEGDYALVFFVQMFQAQDKNGVSKGPQRLGVMVDAYSLTDPAAEVRKQFYSMGSSADKSFAPSADGKGLVPVPGGPSSTFPNSTNWAMLLNSMYDCGLPEGTFDNDLTVLDGVWVHITNVPEPEERKGFGGRTGEAAEERKPGNVAIVSEIKEDGKPWEGTGGIPEAPAAPAAAAPKAPVRGVARPTAAAPRPAPKAAAPAARPAPVAARRPAPAPAPAPVEEAAAELTEDDIATAAANAVAAVLEMPANANGMTKVSLRVATFKAARGAKGEFEDLANAVLETYFSSDENLNLVLGPMGYVSKGGAIAVAA